MKRALLSLLLVIGVGGMLLAHPSVQQVVATPAPSSGFTLLAHTSVGCTVSCGGGALTTSAINCTGAKLLVMVWVCNSCGAGSNSDSSSNTWSTPFDAGATGSNVVWMSWVVGSPVVSASQTFSVTASDFPSVSVSCWNKGSAADTHTVLNSITYPHAATSITPAVPNELFITGAVFAVLDTLSINSSFLGLDQVNYGSGNHIGVGTAYLSSTGSSAQAPTWSDTAAAAGAIVMAAFKP